MFDEKFFEKELAKRGLEYGQEHGGLGLRIELVTRDGERLDALKLEADAEGVRLETRDDRLVFVPYGQIAHVDVALLRDHRIEAFELHGAD